MKKNIGKPMKPEGATHIHFDCHPGLVMEGTKVVEIHNAHGQHYWKATEQIGSIFGSEVEGELEAYGRTKEETLERLAVKRRELHDSLWA